MLPGEVYVTILDNSDISKVWVRERQVNKGETVVIEGELIPRDTTEKLIIEIKDEMKKMMFEIKDTLEKKIEVQNQLMTQIYKQLIIEEK